MENMRYPCSKCRTSFDGDHLKCPACGYAGPYPESKEEAERRSWKECQERELKKHKANPLLAYTYKILGNVPEYEKSFGQEQEDRAANRKFRKEMLDKVENERIAGYNKWFYHIRTDRKDPDREFKVGHYWSKVNPRAKELGITNEEQWNEMVAKERPKEQKEDRENARLIKADRELENNSPIRMFYRMIGEIKTECECEAPKTRAGKFCKICILAGVLREKAIDLFKDAAEGRTSYV